MSTHLSTREHREETTMATVAEDTRPPLSLVKDAPIEGAVVEHQGETLRRLPAWLRADDDEPLAARDLALMPLRGYRRLGRRWMAARRDYHPQLIQTAEDAIRTAAGSVADEEALREVLLDRRAAYKEHKRWHWIKTSGWTAASTIGTATGLVVGGFWTDLLMGIAALTAGAYHGRPGADQPSQAAELTANGELIELPPTVEPGKPFPIALAQTPEQVRECVLRATAAENVPVVEVIDITRQPWGWQCTVRVSEGTPAAIIKAAGDLETRMDLPTNGVKVQPIEARRSCAVLRLVEGDPFAGAPAMPYRAPKSISITERSRIGTSVGGEALAASLAGVMGLVVAASGGGKTGLLQALAEVTTACHDNITIDLDPHGDGLEDLHDCVRITARSHQQIEAVLFFFLMLSKARARLRAKLGMGKKWKISKEHPHFTLFFDEFPKGSDLAKRLAFELLLVGRKEAVSLEIASQGGTKLYLGENIAQMIALKAVGPCKVGDTRAVFGDGAVSEGWMPHQLSPATDTDPKDAGHIYIQGVPGQPDEPIEYAVHETPSAALKKLAAERLEAGLVEPDRESLAAMAGVDLPDIDGLPDLLSWEQLLRLCGAKLPDAPISAEGELARAMAADAVDLMTKAGAHRMRTEILVAALIDHDDAYAGLTTDQLKTVFREGGVGAPVSLGAMDGMLNPRGYKREMLAAVL
ncbi:hypothetical protein AB0F24_17380 [Streptomyces platensis]|uniref:hypothetical protein n=1 Tax=Streptomyces platensis TaxID=58346 RepID=UPI0033E6E48F